MPPACRICAPLPSAQWARTWLIHHVSVYVLVHRLVCVTALDYLKCSLPAVWTSSPPSPPSSPRDQFFPLLASQHLTDLPLHQLQSHCSVNPAQDPQESWTQISAWDTVFGCPWVGHSQSLIVLGKLGKSYSLFSELERKGFVVVESTSCRSPS